MEGYRGAHGGDAPSIGPLNFARAELAVKDPARAVAALGPFAAGPDFMPASDEEIRQRGLQRREEVLQRDIRETLTRWNQEQREYGIAGGAPLPPPPVLNEADAAARMSLMKAVEASSIAAAFAKSHYDTAPLLITAPGTYAMKVGYDLAARRALAQTVEAGVPVTSSEAVSEKLRELGDEDVRRATAHHALSVRAAKLALDRAKSGSGTYVQVRDADALVEASKQRVAQARQDRQAIETAIARTPGAQARDGQGGGRGERRLEARLTAHTYTH